MFWGIAIIVGVLLVFGTILGLGLVAQELISAKSASGVSPQLAGAFDGTLGLLGLLAVVLALTLVIGAATGGRRQ